MIGIESFIAHEEDKECESSKECEKWGTFGEKEHKSTRKEKKCRRHCDKCGGEKQRFEEDREGTRRALRQVHSDRKCLEGYKE